MAEGNNPGSAKLSPTEEDQIKSLAEKLDDDIDKFIEGLPKRPYKDGWPQDRWREEFDKHPFFMTKPPNENEELSPLVEGLQQLKYDENENTPDELAITYKNDGNFSFKCKKYRDAIINYTAGLKCDCSNDLKATLYNNRAAANFFLKNYRSALSDSKNALNLNSNYEKAEIRIAQCYYFLEKYEECIKICDNILSRESNSTIVELKKKAVLEKKSKERDLRKKKKLEQKLTQEDKLLLDCLSSRNFKIQSSSNEANIKNVKKLSDISELNPYYNELPLKRVHLDGTELVWPVIFLYPSYNIFDCVQEFKENITFREHLDEMLSEYPEWDSNRLYKSDAVSIYFADEDNNKYKVSADETLQQIMKHERFIVKNGVPSFFILPQNSKEEKDFLDS